MLTNCADEACVGHYRSSCKCSRCECSRREVSRARRSRRVLAIAIVAHVLVGARAARADDDPWLGPDKALHFSLSALIAGGGYAAAVPLTDDRRWRAAAGAGLAIAAGAGKEIADRYDGGDASW